MPSIAVAERRQAGALEHAVKHPFWGDATGFAMVQRFQKPRHFCIFVLSVASKNSQSLRHYFSRVTIASA